ncbi:MAG: alanine--tRNA ligase [Bacteroidia bacterium]
MQQLTANEIRATFLNFFESKKHQIVPSAPMVVKGDPTLMFNNSGMAPFKDIFLGNSPVKFPRITDTQKCLRVSGKHNDLEEVGVDTYHHTMFEMLGNWSFGDYFKTEAITWAWELLTDVYKIDKDRLYVTVFEGSKADGVPFDQQAFDTWKQFVPEDRILMGNKKDNFWEMGDMGPCGPCTEIHYDGRTNEERAAVSGADRVNNDDPQVIEIWNNVFMEFNRKADGSLEKLPAQHVDTGMGFERLVRVLQGKQSNYDSDVFLPLIHAIEKLTNGLTYETFNPTVTDAQERLNVAMRVIADHIRTVSFSIADGQLPSNTGAGYVIRRILRRAIRYGYQSLQIREPFMYKLVNALAAQMGGAFPELKTQQQLIEKVIKEEEQSFFKTLASGLLRLDAICNDTRANKATVINGEVVFELYDTYGFPVDLTSLIARENNLSIDEEGFKLALQKQKERSRAATTVDTGDWINVCDDETIQFVGYTQHEIETKIIKYRKVKAKNKEQYQVVLNPTPFYAESGGQVGDTGTLKGINDTLYITDTRKENNLIVHFTDALCDNLTQTFVATIDADKRALTENNHSATHLLHAALRGVLGTHVEQKGSLVNGENLRFDFSHFSKVTDEEIAQIETIVNNKIRENVPCIIAEMSIDQAKATGAMALFGEKYGDTVRVVTMDKNYSIELCGGTHVKATGSIGLFKIVSESAVAAGVRRIEAITSTATENYYAAQTNLLNEVKIALKNPKDVLKSVNTLLDTNALLQKQIDLLFKEKVAVIKKQLLPTIKNVNGINMLHTLITLDNAEAVKDLLYQIKGETENLYAVIGCVINDKPTLNVVLSDNLIKDKNMNAANIVRTLAKEINGGGGGQAFYATAGGTTHEGLPKAIGMAEGLV